MAALCWLGNIEPALDDMLSEDIVLALMARRGTSPEIVRNLLEGIARSQSVVSTTGHTPAMSPRVNT
jgi:hypothetical protein